MTTFVSQFPTLKFAHRKKMLTEMLYTKGDLNADELEFFQLCINAHHQSHGNSVFQKVTVAPNPKGYPTNNFHCVYTVDGQEVNDIVGVGVTLKANPERDPVKVLRAKVLRALRRTCIDPEVRDYLLETPVCELCGAEVTSETAHVDHCGDMEFATLATNFIKDLGLETFELESRFGDADYIKDPLIVKAWQEYHDAEARVQLLCKPCNLSKPKQKVAA